MCNRVVVVFGVVVVVVVVLIANFVGVIAVVVIVIIVIVVVIFIAVDVVILIFVVVVIVSFAPLRFPLSSSYLRSSSSPFSLMLFFSQFYAVLVLFQKCACSFAVVTFSCPLKEALY